MTYFNATQKLSYFNVMWKHPKDDTLFYAERLKWNQDRKSYHSWQLYYPILS